MFALHCKDESIPVNVRVKISVNFSKHRLLGCGSSTPLCKFTVTTGESLPESRCFWQNYSLEGCLANIFFVCFYFFQTRLTYEHLHISQSFLFSVLCLSLFCCFLALWEWTCIFYCLWNYEWEPFHISSGNRKGKWRSCFFLCQPFKTKV